MGTKMEAWKTKNARLANEYHQAVAAQKPSQRGGAAIRSERIIMAASRAWAAHRKLKPSEDA